MQQSPARDDEVALKRRDRAAWARMYDQYVTELYAFIAHLMHGQQSVAEELHQETWLAALASIEQFAPDRGDFRNWIFGIARRQVALYYRRRARRQTSGLVTFDTIPAGEQFNGAIVPEDVAEHVERVSAVRAALAELGSDARRVLLDKYVDNLSVNDIAQRLGKSPKAVESSLSRARSRMRKLLRWYVQMSTPNTR